METIRSSPYDEALNEGLVGLAFSGGGIRSATFNLGVLQGLAEAGLLSEFDYLSTVSGGGYIGGWLTAWIQRASLPVVETNISTSINPKSDEGRPVRFLRDYSQYLAPQPGMFSADSWTMLAVFVRNLLLNQTVILLMLAAALTVPLLPIVLVQVARQYLWVGAGMVLGAAASAIWACRLAREAVVSRGKDERWGHRDVVQKIALSILASCVLFAIGAWSIGNSQGISGIDLSRDFYWAAFLFTVSFIALSLPHFARDWKLGYGSNPKTKKTHGLWLRHTATLFAASLASMGFFLFPKHIVAQWAADTMQGDWRVLVFGPPLVAVAFVLTIVFYLGIAGLQLTDGRREWWARLGAYLLLMSFGWLALSSITVFGPQGLYRLSISHKITLASIWAVVSSLGTKLANDARTGDKPPSGTGERTREAIISLAPYVFVLGLLLLLSIAVQFLVESLQTSWEMPSVLSLFPPWNSNWILLALAAVSVVLISLKPGGKGGSVFRWVGIVLLPVLGAPWLSLVRPVPPHSFVHSFTHYWNSLDINPVVPIALFAVLGLSAYSLASRFNVNEFSMHHFYRNRLVRAYLGASRERRTRRPNPFTGFDELDEISLSSLRVEEKYFGPLPIVNAAVNITKGQDLATQERMAESFIFSPLRCGFDFFRPQVHPSRTELARYGYQKPEWAEFNAKQGARLGMTMAISGAAVNPNMGYHSKPVAAFLLSLFNVRLGFWVRNPAKRQTTGRSAPELGPLYLFRELLGSMDVRTTYLNLSDGGHFENMGLYELVRRRCRFIIVSDAEQDGRFGFAGMGSAIRKCRTDFGVEIRIDLRTLCPNEGKFSPNHFAVGTISYPENPDKLGYVLYLKASLTGDEPSDVLEYRERFTDFPHQATINQFFTESQFESYRALGHHVVTQAIPDSTVSFKDEKARNGFFTELCCRMEDKKPEKQRESRGDAAVLKKIIKRNTRFVRGAANDRS